MLYARAITLRTCGRFTVVASDFGSEYRTQQFVSSEALYASLTRGATWTPRRISLNQAEDTYDFARDYRVAEMPVWFTPGIFANANGTRLSNSALDFSAFNVVAEFYPSTSNAYVFRKGILEEKGRSGTVPTYGRIQAILPNHEFVTYALSNDSRWLEYHIGQTFLLGKKRTMVQIKNMSEIKQGVQQQGICQTEYLQFPPAAIQFFGGLEIFAATLRFVVVRGKTHDNTEYWNFQFVHRTLALPSFYLAQIPAQFL